MDVLLIQSAYNNLIVPEIINEYKDRILFAYIDYKNMNYFIDKYNIVKYYSFIEVLPHLSTWNIINYYKCASVICDNVLYNKSGKKIIKIRENFPLTWLDYNIGNCYVIFKNSAYYNIPDFILSDKNANIKKFDLPYFG